MGEQVSGRGLRVGVVGVGAISGAYFSTFDRLDGVRVVAVADRDAARAATVAGQRGVPAMTVDDLVRSPQVDLVLNLTTPAAHADVAAAAIAAGMPVYGEKPLAASVADGRRMLEAAAAAGVRLGCAPDTVLGTGTQTARAAIDGGLIGTPVAATATMVTPGHERWHPNPDFYYQPGGGPLFDMGPYYLTALVTLLGPIVEVIGAGSRTRATRVIGSGPRAGERIPVAVDTHVTGVVTHASGALSTLVMSFDAVATASANIEVHGDRASLEVPDPNRFDGDVVLHPLDGDRTVLPVSAGYRDAARGYGVVDFAATPADRRPRTNADVALHVLDAMSALLESAATGRAVRLGTTCARPAPVPLADLPGADRRPAAS